MGPCAGAACPSRLSPAAWTSRIVLEGGRKLGGGRNKQMGAMSWLWTIRLVGEQLNTHGTNRWVRANHLPLAFRFASLGLRPTLTTNMEWRGETVRSGSVQSLDWWGRGALIWLSLPQLATAPFEIAKEIEGKCSMGKFGLLWSIYRMDLLGFGLIQKLDVLAFSRTWKIWSKSYHVVPFLQQKSL